MVWRGYKNARRDEDNMSDGLLLGTLAVLIGFSASSLVNYNFGDSEPLLMLLSVVALALVAGAGFGPQRAQRELRAEWFLWPLCAGCGGDVGASKETTTPGGGGFGRRALPADAGPQPAKTRGLKAPRFAA